MKKLIIYLMLCVSCLGQDKAIWYKIQGTDTNATQQLDSAATFHSSNMPSVVTGATLTNSDANNAWNFAGDDWFDTGVVPFGGITSLLISAWIYPTERKNDTMYPIACVGKFTAYAGSAFTFSQYSASGTSNLQLLCSVSFNDALTSAYVYSKTNSIFVDNWYHVAMWWVSERTPATNNIQMFVNGIRQAQQSYSGPVVTNIPATSQPLTIGKYITGKYYKGGIDDIRVYTNQVVEESFITNLYTSGRYPDTEPSIGNSPFIFRIGDRVFSGGTK